MKILLIKPAITKSIPHKKFISWNLEPLSIAILNSLIPEDIEVRFYDDRLEDIPFDEDCDLVGISVETYTARRAYMIAREFRKRSIPVVLGGYHPTLMPEEAIKYSDAVVLGEAEGVWKRVIEDARRKKLEKIYTSKRPCLYGIIPKRSIYKDKKYLPLTLVETARGCPFSCEFCSTGAIFKRMYYFRKIEDVITDIKISNRRLFLFTDENILCDVNRSKRLFSLLRDLRIKWIGQASPYKINKELAELMKYSGCIGLLIGFESLKRKNLISMGKYININIDYSQVIDILHSYGIGIYASFIVGFTNEQEEIKEIFRFLVKKKVMLAGFSPLMPYPNTPIYHKMVNEKRIERRDWWMKKPYPYWSFVYFNKEKGDMETIKSELSRYRRKFYSIPYILKRFNYPFLFLNPFLFFLHPFINLAGKMEIKTKERLSR